MDAEIFYKHLGKNLKHYRKQCRKTQEQLGNEIGITKSAIVNYETGIRKIPLDVLIKISQIYGVSVDSLTGRKTTIADILKSEIGTTELDEHEEEMLISFLKALLYKKAGNKNG